MAATARHHAGSFCIFLAKFYISVCFLQQDDAHIIFFFSAGVFILVLCAAEVIANFGGCHTDFPKNKHIKQQLRGRKSLVENIMPVAA